MPNWEEVMEEKWGRPFVHESGHAIMAILQGIPLRGIYFLKESKKFAVIVDLPPDVKSFTKAHFLFLAGGNTAELIKYGNADEGTAKSDWTFFDNPNAPPLETTMEEARSLLLSRNRQMKRLVSLLKAKCRGVDYDITKLPEADPLSNGAMCNVLLSKEETDEAIRKK
jgi:hypothetical protein